MTNHSLQIAGEVASQVNNDLNQNPATDSLKSFSNDSPLSLRSTTS